MSHRNLLVLLTAITVSYTCHVRADRNSYGRYLTQALEAIDRWSLVPVPQSDLFESAMHGMVGELHKRGDQHSTFINARDATDFKADLEQEFGGVGVMISMEGKGDQRAIIAHPLLGAPAFEAGVRARDRILRIDGFETTGMTLYDIKHLMRGEKGEPVELTVLHEGATSPVTLTIVRDTINVPSVLGDHRLADGAWDFRLEQDPRIGYLQITSFANKTVDELDAALANLATQDVRALILDLRDNPGGALDVATEATDRFIPGGKTIVSIRGRDGPAQEEYISSGQGVWLNLPMVVLVNRNSASASEIVAACLQDHGRAVIVGERTYGKGTVQQVLDIESGRSRLKLTVASYWRPNGKNIHRWREDAPTGEDWGVLHDDGFVVTLSKEEEERLIEARRRRILYNEAPAVDDISGDDTDGDNTDETEPAADTPPSLAPVDLPLQKAVEHLQSQID